MIKIDKFKKSKKGSGLIIVIMTFAFLSIVGMAFISMSVYSYKLRIAKSNVKTSLYASEAGLDEAYGIIGNKVDESITKGNEEVTQFVKEVNTIIQNPEKKIDQNGMFINLDHKEWKDYYNSCIDKKKNNKNYYRCTLKDEEFKKFQNEIFKDIYKDNILGCKDDDGIIDELNKESNYKFEIKSEEKEIKEKPKIVAKEKKDDNKEELKTNNKLLTINLKSDFIHKGIAKRIVADYEIYTPQYKEAYYKETNNMTIPKNPAWSKAIAINGSMKVDGRANIEGDTYIKGETDINKNSGIILSSPMGDVKFHGKVATPKDFKFIRKTNCSVKGDLFADNVQLKKDATDSILNVINGSMYTNDDLEIDANGSKVEIDGAYYGLSDGSHSEKANQSSSININAVDGYGKVDCLLRVKDLNNEGSIIMGTSYADFIRDKEEKYQTGESLSIKGNYRAYSFPLDEKEKYKNDDEYKKFLDVGYEYYRFEKNPEYPPIAFVYNFLNGNKLYAHDKSKYFKYICEDEDYKNIINKGKIDKKEKGVYINLKRKDKNGNIEDGYISTGAIVSNGDVNDARYSMDDDDKVVSPKREKYESEVYKKENFIDKKKISDNCSLNVFTKNGKAESKEIEDKILDNALIIINGDLTVNSNLKFTGALIVTGNLTIENGASLDITYDESVVAKLIADNYKNLKDVFINNNSEEKYDVSNPENIGVVGTQNTIKTDKLIKMRNWKIVK